MSATSDLLPVAPGVPWKVYRDQRERAHHVEEVLMPAFSTTSTHYRRPYLAFWLLARPSKLLRTQLLRALRNCRAPGEFYQLQPRRVKLYPVSLRKGISATTIADAGITIPGVSLVIDVGKEIVVDKGRAALNWARPYIAEQRKGRTGRTNLYGSWKWFDHLSAIGLALEDESLWGVRSPFAWTGASSWMGYTTREAFWFNIC